MHRMPSRSGCTHFALVGTHLVPTATGENRHWCDYGIGLQLPRHGGAIPRAWRDSTGMSHEGAR